MDDDPEPALDPTFLEKEQKCAAEIGEENALESGDVGTVVDPESPKKSTAVKDMPAQTESKSSIFRRKEWMDQSQQVDLPSSAQSSTTSVRKPSRRGSQRLIGQESRRSSQQPASQLPVLSQKPSRAQAGNEADTKDPVWVNQRTGKVMKCRSQQTSLIWERKALSEILRPSSNESVPCKEEEAEFANAEEDLTSSGETADERCPGQRPRLGSKQLEGKVSKHSGQQHFERFGSRRSSQRSSRLPSTVGLKYARSRPSKGMDDDEEEVTWVNQRTGKEMKCKAQQTSHIWGSRTPSGILRSSRRGSQVGREEESGFSTANEVTSATETGAEESTAQESDHSIQREGSVSKRTSWQQLGRMEAHQNSQPTTEQPYQPNLKSSREELPKERAAEEQPFGTNRRTGKEMKCQSQQTSLVWEHRTLSDILRVHDKLSDLSGAGVYEEDEASDGASVMAPSLKSPEEGQVDIPFTLEDEEGDQVAVKDAHNSVQTLEAERARQAEEQKAEVLRKKQKSKIDRAQQTDSVESFKKELAESGLQTDVSEGVKITLVDQHEDPDDGSVQGSRRGSQELARKDSYCSSPQPERRVSRRSSQQSLRGAEEATWVSRKTGRLVKNQSQQTDRSWLQYFALKSQKLKKCSSQQTDESFLQRYRTGKQAYKEHRKNHTEPDMRRCTQCGDLCRDDFPFDPSMFSSISTTSTLSTLSSQETSGTDSAEEQELSPSGGDEEQPQTQRPFQTESRRSSQQASGQKTPKGPGQKEDQTFGRWGDACEGNTASESSLLYTEAENKIQQTYSMISFPDGIWMNRKTGKLLVTHSQQTSETAVNGEALEKSESVTEGGLATAEEDDSGAGVNRDLQEETEVGGEQASGQEARRGSQQGQNGESHLLPEQPTEEELQSADEVEKMVCSRLSEATLLSIESPDAEDGPVQIYTVVSLEKGSWRNIQTGKLLASQSQQTEASSQEDSAEDGASDGASVMAPSQKSPEEGQVDIS